MDFSQYLVGDPFSSVSGQQKRPVSLSLKERSLPAVRSRPYTIPIGMLRVEL